MYFDLIIIGSGYGLEFAYFYNRIGSKIFRIEKIPNVLLFSDIENSYKKYGIIILKYLDYIQCTKVILKTNKNINKILYVDIYAIGICPNTENLEEIGITLNIRFVDYAL